MTSLGGDPANRSGSQSPTLNPEKAALMAGFINGMEGALFNPEAQTVTVGIDLGGDVSLSKSLSRLAFLHLEDASPEAEGPFSVAVRVLTHQFGEEEIAEKSEEEIKTLGYGQLDGVRVALLDRGHELMYIKNIVCMPGPDEDASTTDFLVREAAEDYTDDYIPTPNPLDSAYRIGGGDFYTDDLSEGIVDLGSIASLRMIVNVLKNGQTDGVAIDNLLDAAARSKVMRVLPDASPVAKLITPHLYGIFKHAVETPHLKSAIAHER
jgi:hypothetical protein